LTQIIRRMHTTGKQDWRSTVGLAVQIVRALDAAHAYKLVHGSLTPQAVLVRDADRIAKLSGLLLGRALEQLNLQPGGRLNEQTDDTPYMSPERTYGTSDLDIRSD